jgi:hypothetical protein
MTSPSLLLVSILYNNGGVMHNATLQVNFLFLNITVKNIYILVHRKTLQTHEK